jgi:hypothetical protein
MPNVGSTHVYSELDGCIRSALSNTSNWQRTVAISVVPSTISTSITITHAVMVGTPVESVCVAFYATTTIEPSDCSVMTLTL